MHQLFFDLDGTLTDPALGITACLAYAVQKLGHPAGPPSSLARFIGPPLRDCFAELLQTRDPIVIEEAVRHYRERFSTTGLFENAVYPRLPEALAELQEEGFALSVVTSKPTVYANRIVDHFGLREYFPRVYGSELSGERSSKTELVAHALKHERAEPERVCMVGDRSHDVVGAKANGVKAVGVTWGFGTLEELQTAGADHIVETVEALLLVCRGLPVLTS